MRKAFDLVPFHGRAGSVRAENGVCRVVGIGLGVVACGLYDLLCVVAGVIARRAGAESARAGGVGREDLGIAVHLGHRSHALYDAAALGVEAAAHGADIGDGSAYLLGRHLEAEFAAGLKQHALGLHECLAHGAVHRLAEVAALGVLYMRPARDEAYLNVRQR